ncbi:MAG: UDP-glucose 4-epimerase GalE [Candidatus Ancillula sp.]|jgi:UDP-glucose 4-epimerase|nr:UDP-glucose 4-epimerase GalE [Candidatus Ancillula sp.]
MKKILVTGGAGYIGSHTVVDLVLNGFQVHICDNFNNSSPKAVHAVEKILGVNIPLTKLDLKDKSAVGNMFEHGDFDGVIHFAGLKAVGESTSKPLAYYENNLLSTLNLLDACKKYNVQNFVFSSSATVYSDPAVVAYDEETTKTGKASSPYGTSKLEQEWILEDCVNGAEFPAGLRVVSLRYFNPIGAHSSSMIGEDPRGIPNNLAPFITQVMVGRREFLSVFGGDYATEDGTCIRDYIHVTDLARGHRLALEYIEKQPENSMEYINLGSGKGSSVLEVLHAFEATYGKSIPYKIVSRRPGDLPEFYAKTEKAQRLLNFKTEYSLDDMARDSWNWQKSNPNGFE